MGDEDKQFDATPRKLEQARKEVTGKVQLMGGKIQDIDFEATKGRKTAASRSS